MKSETQRLDMREMPGWVMLIVATLMMLAVSTSALAAPSVTARPGAVPLFVRAVGKSILNAVNVKNVGDTEVPLVQFTF